MTTRISFCLGALLGLVTAACYSNMSTEGLRCSEDAACNPGQLCSYEGICRVSCNPQLMGPECQANPDARGYGCWEDPNSVVLGGSCIPAVLACGAGYCPNGWVCAAKLGFCCPPWRPNTCPNGTCGATPEDCTAS